MTIIAGNALAQMTCKLFSVFVLYHLLIFCACQTSHRISNRVLGQTSSSVRSPGTLALPIQDY